MKSILAIVVAATAFSAAAGDLPRLPAESEASYLCRQHFVPESRACFARCDAEHAAGSDEHWTCLHACTLDALHVMQACRTTLATTPEPNAGPGPLAAR